MADVFDQLSYTQGQPGQQQTAASSPTSTPAPTQQQQQQPTSSGPQMGDVFDKIEYQGDTRPPIHAPSTQPDTGNQPGLLDRLYETSGAKGLVDLGKATLGRPIDMYHQAVESAQKGDWKSASETASKLINYVSSAGLADKNSPLLKAAEALIMQPVDEVKESYKEKRRAGQGAGQAAVNTASEIVNQTPSDTETKNLISRVKSDYGKKDYSAIIGDVVGAAATKHSTAAVPILGGAAKQVGGNLDQDLHAHNYSAAAGDVLGPLLTFGAGKLLGAFGEAGEAAVPEEGTASAIKPSTREVAGQQVPVAADTPQAKFLSTMASKEGAKNFIKEQVQPAAVKATQSNFAKSAFQAADKLRDIKGEPTILSDSTAGKVSPPVLNNVDDIAKFLQSEAKSTYTKLDQAAKPEVEAWEAQYGDMKPGEQSSSPIVDQYGQPFQSEAVPPKPKLFTELQDQIKDARRVIESQFTSQTDKASAIEDLPKFLKERDAFLAKHSDVVNSQELQGANELWGKSQKYEWLADRMRSATSGIGANSGEFGQTPALNLKSMEKLPSQYDTKFGDGEFSKLLGPEGIRNYDRVLNLLQAPKAGSAFMQWLQDVPFNFGKPVKIPLNSLVDNLLFNPTFGQRAMQLYDAAGAGAKAAKTVAKAATKAAPVGMAQSNASKKKQLYSSLSGSLSGQ